MNSLLVILLLPSPPTSNGGLLLSNATNILFQDPIKTNEKQEGAGLKRRARDELWVDLCYFGYSDFIDFGTLPPGSG